MAIRKNTRRFDPRYFMDEKIELTENQKQSIKTLLEREIANGNQINEGVLQDLAIAENERISDMKITKQQLRQIISEEIGALSEAAEGEEIMAAVSDIPAAAQKMADNIRREIESLTAQSGLDPSALAGIVAELIQADY